MMIYRAQIVLIWRNSGPVQLRSPRRPGSALPDAARKAKTPEEAPDRGMDGGERRDAAEPGPREDQDSVLDEVAGSKLAGAIR